LHRWFAARLAHLYAAFVTSHVRVGKVDFRNGRAGIDRPAVVLRILILSVGSFAVGTGTFVVTDVPTDIAEDLSVPIASAGLLVTVFAVTLAVSPPVLVSSTSGVGRRSLLVGALVLLAAITAGGQASSWWPS
jgi:predicted MFS family arabinose efflux permease